jgi:hypothetical protein
LLRLHSFSHVFEFALQIPHFLVQITALIVNVASSLYTVQLARFHLLADSGVDQMSHEESLLSDSLYSIKTL